MSINIQRVKQNHQALAVIDALPGEGVTRSTITKEDIKVETFLKIGSLT